MKTKKNIVIIIDSIGGGGAERVMLDLARGIVQSGHNAFFIALEKRIDHQVYEEVPVFILYDDRDLKAITRRKKARLQSAKKLEGLVSEIETSHGKIHLFLSNLDPTNGVVALTKFDNVKYVLHSAMEKEVKRERRLGPFKYFRKIMQKRVMNDKDLVAVSQGVATEAATLGLIKPRSVTTIYNPCNVALIRTMSEQYAPEIPNKPFILHVGRVVKAKRHDILFSALALVPDQIMVCLCKDVEKAKAIADKYGVADRVVLPGFTNNPYAWMKRAELTVLSSDYEGLPTVLIESLICGTPIVSTNCTYGPSEIMTDKLSEYLCDTGDPFALSKNIKKALVDYPDLESLPILKAVELSNVVDQYLKLAN
ncbi:glycosyltransferase [Bermanella marisrubri]|uniref:Glycosyl transferase, group 1 family protein n=1 Tax=Bermanella marisrubri TaxID=207949 RepID=Q1N5F3_9GAMM|nr:glycosyltransferase [Bermanella marisrubri]EAT13124.1 glycosyl transferase, group 1 family protein [Oceanobacter sp. RED65] [Bermanella marisrubri]QIZ83902.1 glycosyltransferase [Bermanella marisrubri]